MDNLFIIATRSKLRFPSTRGELTVEDVWSLPLTSRNMPSLDQLAKDASAGIRLSGEESFVETKVDPVKDIFQLRLEILKYIIGVRQAENQAVLDAKVKAEQREKLQELISKKQDAALEGESMEELQKRLDALK